MVLEIRAREGKGHGELARVGRQLGVHPEALRGWVRQAEIDNGTRPGTTTEDAQRITELERENRELRRANEILKAASAYFARELDIAHRSIGDDVGAAELAAQARSEIHSDTAIQHSGPLRAADGRCHPDSVVSVVTLNTHRSV